MIFIKFWIPFFNKISFDKVSVYGAPRRLAIEISGLTDKQEDIVKTVKGPISKIAFDESGNLSPAGLGFAKKNGVEPKDLYVQDNYLYAKTHNKPIKL